MTNKDLKKQYIKEIGYSSFNKYNNTDYSKWLESQLISALNEVIKLGLHSVSNSFYCLDAGIKGSEHLCKKQCDSCKKFQQ